MIDNKDKKGDFAFRGQSHQDAWAEMTYAGALSFLRRRYSRDLQGVDVAVLGVAFDQATTNRSGARLGPRAIRAASTQLAELKTYPLGLALHEHLSIIDYGDVYLDSGYPDKMVEAVMATATHLFNHDVKPLSLGGDHFISYPLIKAAAAKYGPLSLVHFDAHCDTWPDDGMRLDHGSMFARAAKEGFIEPKRSVQIGLRTWNDDDYGFHIFDANHIHQGDLKAIGGQIIDIIGHHPAYLTVDIDCLDPAFAPGTGTPVAGGLSSQQLLTLLQIIGGFPANKHEARLPSLQIIGADVVEVAPAYDISEITAIAAATIAQSILIHWALDSM